MSLKSCNEQFEKIPWEMKWSNGKLKRICKPLSARSKYRKYEKRCRHRLIRKYDKNEIPKIGYNGWEW